MDQTIKTINKVDWELVSSFKDSSLLVDEYFSIMKSMVISLKAGTSIKPSICQTKYITGLLCKSSMYC